MNGCEVTGWIRRWVPFRGVLLIGLLLGEVHGQAPTSWTVRQESVRAHEEFLASDVLAGRGSATRDEEIAATYVASEFMSYGLKTAPGMAGYLQGAAVDAPVLDGKATVTAGSVTLEEGRDFQLLASTGVGFTGALKAIDAKELAHPSASSLKGLVLLLGELTEHETAQRAITGLRRSGAAAVIAVRDPSTDALLTMFGGKTRTPIRLKDAPVRPGGVTVIAVSRTTMNRLQSAGAVTAMIAVHAVSPTVPRMTYNAIGYLPGSDAAAGTILLTAHLDHLGIGMPVHGDAIFNGANDDAAGTTAVLELAHALAAGPALRRSVLFVCYGSEEAGELGSDYFGQHSPVPLKDLVANVEFEMIGTQDPKMPKGVLLFTGWERSNLGPALKQHGAQLGPDPYPEQHFFERSDNYQLALKGVVAHTAAGWGTPPTYHQPSDDIAHLDISFMTGAIQSLVEPMRWLASTDFRPAWNTGGQPKD